jgi:hypothetical protein
VDRGVEVFSKEADARAFRYGIRLDFTRPAKSAENAFIEGLDRRLCDKRPNGDSFFSLDDAKKT